MEDSKAYVSRLLTEKLTGVISADDAAIIDRLIETDTDVKAEWEWMNEKLAAFSGVSEADTAHAWSRLSPAVTRKKRPLRIISIAAAAAACVAVAVIAGRTMLKPASSSPNNFFAQSIEWTEDSIVMHGDRGRVLNLTSVQDQQINSGEATLHVTDSSLQVQGGEGDGPQWQTLLVPAGLTYKVILADGSMARLNSGTRIKFPLSFTGGQREVFIDGEAFFSIATDAHKPFVVRTRKTDIQVLGTQFNVNTYNADHIRTSLVDGAVSTSSTKGKLLLSPGQEAVLTDSSFITRPFDETSTLSWMEGAYYFHDVPLKNLSGILTRWFKARIEFDTRGLENKMFSGALLKDQPLEVFLENLELSDNIHSVYKDGVVHFK